MMRVKVAVWLLAIALVCCGSQKYERYLELVESYPNSVGPIGDAKRGELQLVTDPQEMAEIEAKTGRPVGIFAEDRYWIWLNDPLRYPSGGSGVYGRILWRHSLDGPPGVAVLPIDPKSGKIYLICLYRHATRSWELELPAGLREPGETVEEAGRREVLEESGVRLSNLTMLGCVAADPGFTNTVVPVLLGEVSSAQAAKPEEDEAIAGVVALSVEEVRDAMRRGEITLDVGGERRTAAVRSGLLAYALLQLDLRGEASGE